MSKDLSALTFYRRIIFVHEMALDQLNGEAGLSDTTSADNDELVFPEELCGRIKGQL